MKTSAKEKFQDHNKEQEDYLAPTKIEQHNNPGKEDDISANLTHSELHERLDLYSSIGGDMEQYFKVQAIKQKYLEEIKEKEASRTKSDIHYGQGIRSGLPHTRHEAIKDMREQSDQKLRNEITREAKSYYAGNNSLSKNFREYKARTVAIRPSFNKSKNKGVDRER